MLNDIEIQKRFPDFVVRNLLVISSDTDGNEFKGFHAHKQANQIIVGVVYPVVVHLISSQLEHTSNIVLEGQVCFIPAGTWSYQEYSRKSKVVVLADLPYDEEDYIRDYREFLKFTKDAK